MPWEGFRTYWRVKKYATDLVHRIEVDLVREIVSAKRGLAAALPVASDRDGGFGEP